MLRVIFLKRKDVLSMRTQEDFNKEMKGKLFNKRLTHGAMKYLRSRGIEILKLPNR